MKFIKRILKKMKAGETNDSIYKREITSDSTITIYCDAPFSLWHKNKIDTDFNLVAPSNANDRHCKLRVNNGDSIELITDGNFSFDLIEVPPRIEIPSGEKLLELVDNKPDNIKDMVRAQVLAQISEFTTQQGGESIEEFDDFSEMEDEFNDAPLAEAEMVLMQEEYQANQSLLDDAHKNTDGQTNTVESAQAPAQTSEAEKTGDSVKESTATATKTADLS